MFFAAYFLEQLDISMRCGHARRIASTCDANPIERMMDDSSSRRFCGSAMNSDAHDAQAGNRTGMTVLFG